MPYTAQKRSSNADKEARDAHGHFIKKGTPVNEAVKTSFSSSGPSLSPNPSHPFKRDSSLDDPLISFQVNNPFKKILYWLNDIRKHQTTTFDFKIKIPLIALPVFLAVIAGGFQLFFNLGKNVQKQEIAALPTPTPVVIVQPTPTPAPVLVTRLGTIKATYQVQSLLSPTPVESTQTAIPTPSRYVLVGKSDQIIFIIAPSTISLTNYLNQRVLVTGLYEKTKNTLSISKTSDIEILP